MEQRQKFSLIFRGVFVLFITVWFMGCRASKVSAQNLPVFPGARGFGSTTVAGRGGVVIKVTNLNDNGSGSLREALGRSGPRIIVFEVGGVIRLQSLLKITTPYVTVAGQTAPSPGITLIYDSVSVRTHDVLIQHLHIRPGNQGPYRDNSPGENKDGIDLASSNSSVYNIVIDHCSISWAVDETASTWFATTHDLTFSNNIISEALQHSIHPKGAHSTGMLIGDHVQKAAIIGNLFAHNDFRNPLTKNDTSTIILNNLIYNPGYAAIHFQNNENIDGVMSASVVGNVIKIKPEGDTSDRGFGIGIASYIKAGSEFYIHDTVSIQNNITNPVSLYTDSYYNSSMRVNQPPSEAWLNNLTVYPSNQVESVVLSGAGARPWDRDSIDERIIRDVRDLTGSIIDNQNYVGGYPNPTSTNRSLNIPTNPNGDDDGDGYTNVEEWIHSFETGTTAPTPIRTPTPMLTRTPTPTPTRTPTPGAPTPTRTPTPTPSSCLLASSGDFNCDNLINESDLNALLGKWMTNLNDITGDNIVNESDLNKLLGSWKAI